MSIARSSLVYVVPHQQHFKIFFPSKLVVPFLNLRFRRSCILHCIISVVRDFLCSQSSLQRSCELCFNSPKISVVIIFDAYSFIFFHSSSGYFRPYYTYLSASHSSLSPRLIYDSEGFFFLVLPLH
jgi:hypothetical protein